MAKTEPDLYVSPADRYIYNTNDIFIADICYIIEFGKGKNCNPLERNMS